MRLFRPKVEKHKELVAEACERVVTEDDRVYRNQVDRFAREFHPAVVTATGLLKARLLGCCFPLYAFINRWSGQPDQVLETIQVLSGFAVMPLVGPDANPSMPLVQAREIGSPFIKKQLAFIRIEVDNGPSTITPRGVLSPNAPAKQMRASAVDGEALGEGYATDGFRGLVATCHEAFEASVGSTYYVPEARQRFERMFIGSVFGRLSVLGDLLQKLS